MNNNEENNIITLEDEDGKAVDFELLGRITLEEQTYIILYPAEVSEDEEDNDEIGVVILKESGTEDSDMLEYLPLESEEEAEKVFEEFQNQNEELFEDEDED
jgi:uncharacterized protein YrzB (UPF0473 family)